MIIKKNEVDAIDFIGLEIFDYTAKPNEKSSFLVIKVKPDISHQLSWSTSSDKYYYILNGSLEFCIDDKNISLNEGDFCIIKKGEKFKYKNISENTAVLILIHTPNFILEKEIFE